MSGFRLAGAAVAFATALILVGACAAQTDGCGGGGSAPRDPGPARTTVVHGRITGAATARPLVVAGTSVTIDASTRVSDLCNSPGAPCDARVFLRPGATNAAAAVFAWSTDAPVVSVFSLSTGTFRLDGGRLILGDGSSWTLARDFTVSSCPGTGSRALHNARVGATFRLDAATGEAVSAGCNGCA